MQDFAQTYVMLFIGHEKQAQALGGPHVSEGK
jgi:hypothetical protein